MEPGRDRPGDSYTHDVPPRRPPGGIVQAAQWSRGEIARRHQDSSHVRRLGTSGHNFGIHGDLLTQGAYAAGVMVWDISNRTEPELLAHHKGTSPHHGGKNKETKDGAWFSMAPFVWQVVSDGDPAALLRGEQYLYASDVVTGLYVLRLRPVGRP